jgi:hypothetical protein
MTPTDQISTLLFILEFFSKHSGGRYQYVPTPF